MRSPVSARVPPGPGPGRDGLADALAGGLEAGREVLDAGADRLVGEADGALERVRALRRREP